MSTEAEQTTIDFSRLGGPVFIGRDRGRKVRDKLDVDKLDVSDVQVSVNVPQNTYSINPSFFLALFGDSIRKFGSEEEFFNKYNINAPDHIMESIKSIVSRALLEKKILVDK